MGWAIGGRGAVIDSTIAGNFRLHNTLGVPAHFHTYMLMGLVPMVLGYFYHACQEAAPREEANALQRAIFWLFVVGGYGFLLMFYVAGADSSPRRYPIYPASLESGPAYSGIALVFGLVLLLGLAFSLWETGRRGVRAVAA